MKKKSLFFYLSFSLILTIGLKVEAAEYFVSPGGNDSNFGIETQPWQTIQKAADTVNPGDSVIVLPGEYNEQVKLKKSGSAGNEIIFRGSNRQVKVLHGFHTNGQDYTKIEDFSITNNTGGWLGGGVFIIDSDYIDIKNNYFYDIAGQGIHCWHGGEGCNNINVLDNKMYRVNFGIGAGGTNWLVEGNEVERLYRFSVFNSEMYGTDADYSRFSGENMIFRNNYFHSTLSSEIGTSHVDGFQTFTSGDVVKNIIIEGNIVQSFHQGMMIDQLSPATGLLFQDFFVRNNVFASGDTGSGELGAGLGIRAYGVSNLVVVNNTFINFSNAISSCKNSKTDGSASTCTTVNNIFLNSAFGYAIDPGSTFQVGYNIIMPANNNTTVYPNDIRGVDPLLVNPSNLIGPDNTPFTADDGFRVQIGSPTINAGISTSGYGVDDDLFNTSRPQGSAWDIGAYEFVESGSDSTLPPPPTLLQVR